MLTPKDGYGDVGTNLDVVATHANISPCYFSVLFKKEVGSTFIEYLTNLRINKAKDLLAQGNLRNYEISYHVGYDNPTYFSTLFKRYTGMSPTAYQKMNSKKN